jgi:hypothetical protein
MTPGPVAAVFSAAMARVERVAAGHGRVRAGERHDGEHERGRPVAIANGDPHRAHGNECRESKARSD